MINSFLKEIKVKSILLMVMYFLSLFFVMSFWQRPYILSFLLFLLIIGIFFIKKMSKKEMIFFIGSGVAGALAESLCSYFGAWEYTLIQIFNVPLWLFFLWVIAGSFLVEINKKLEFFFDSNSIFLNNSYYKDVFILFLVFSTIFIISFVWKFPYVLFFCLLILAFFVIFIEKSYSKLTGFFICSILGVSAEILSVFSGAWSYAIEHILGVSIWMIPGWGLGFLIVIKFYEVYNKIIKF